MSWALPNSIVVDHLTEGESAFEPELPPLVCVLCGMEMVAESEPWPENCTNCHHPIDLETQFAYSRGLDAFSVGQELLYKITPRKRRRNMFTAEEMEGVQYYTQAFNSLQLAFQGVLAESQRRLGIEMMASIVNIFQQHEIMSPLEFAYWGSLMKELSTQLERVKVQEKIANVKPGLFAWILRLRWRARVYQLEKSLKELDEKIVKIERMVRFVQPLKARRKTLPSL